jgi:hypothetical protein
MSFQRLLEAELQRIAAQGRGRLTMDVGVGELDSNIVAADAIGCAFDSLTLATDKLAGASIERVKKISAALAARLNYLLEPISPIETDADRCVVQMRSNPPQQGENGSTYYELLVVTGGSLDLKRYRAAPGQPREAIPAQVTQEVFQRLAEDFAAVIG